MRYNSKLLDDYKEIKGNEILAENLQALNFLNNTQIKGYEDYTIIVPQNLEDLQNEGKQQNNCVGYYYNDSIKRNRDKIFFIRPTENINKSLITCRFNMASRKVREYRLKIILR